MWGLGIAAIICFFLFRRTHIRTVTFFGSSVVKSLLFWFVPVLVLSLVSFRGAQIWLFPVAGFIITLGEELGWRGYLQDALEQVNPVKRAVIIGVMWELWHFTTRMSGGLQLSTWIRVGIFIIALSILSYIMNRLTDKTKSLVIAVTVHAWINILFEINAPSTYVVFGLSIPFWAYLLWKWKKPLFGISKNTSQG